MSIMIYRFPYINNMKVHNLYWQVLESSQTTYYLYGAYLDTRLESLTLISSAVDQGQSVLCSSESHEIGGCNLIDTLTWVRG